MGPNGAGKTTLFNLVSGIYPATRGRIVYFEKDVTGLPAYRRAALGIARTYQITNLFPNLTVSENILMACQALERTKFVMLRPLSSYRRLMDRCSGLIKRVRVVGKAERTGEEPFSRRPEADRGGDGPRRRDPASSFSMSRRPDSLRLKPRP